MKEKGEEREQESEFFLKNKRRDRIKKLIRFQNHLTHSRPAPYLHVDLLIAPLISKKIQPKRATRLIELGA